MTNRYPDDRNAAPNGREYRRGSNSLFWILGGVIGAVILFGGMIYSGNRDQTARVNTGPGINTPAANVGSNTNTTTGSGSLNQTGNVPPPAPAPAPTAPPR